MKSLTHESITVGDTDGEYEGFNVVGEEVGDTVGNVEGELLGIEVGV
jgi:hypothetical protein